MNNNTDGILRVIDQKKLGRLLNDVLTVNEAAEIWGVSEGTIRAAIKKGKFINGIDYRKAGRITLITRDAMDNVYGFNNELKGLR